MNFLPQIRLLLLPSLSLTAALTVAMAGEPPEWQLRPATSVDATGIHLDQIIADSSQQTVISLPHLQLAPAPAAGQMLTLTRAQITDLLQKTAPELATTNWRGAASIRITRRTRPLDEITLKTLLTAALQNEFVKEKGELELRFTRPWTAVSVVDEPLTVRIVDLPMLGVTPNFIVRFELRAREEILGTWQLPLAAKIWREVWVAGSHLQRGQSVLEADLVRERRDVLALRDPLVAMELDRPTLEIAENLPTGTALAVRSIRQRPVIRRGKQAEAVVRDGFMTLSVKVEALEDGLPGQTIRVRNVKSKREFRGKVQNEETIHITL